MPARQTLPKFLALLILLVLWSLSTEAIAQTRAKVQVKTAADVSPALPPLTATRYYRIQPQKYGNAIAMIQLDPAAAKRTDQPRTLVVNTGDGDIFYNDLGHGPDLGKKDGVYAAYVTLNAGELKLAERLFQKKLFGAGHSRKLSREIRVPRFSGRSLVALEPLSLEPPSASPLAKFDDLMLKRFRARPLNVRIPDLRLFPVLTRPEKTLLINRVDVVADPNRTFDLCDTDGAGNDVDPDAPWSFKTLLTHLNDTGLSDQAFVHDWLRTWMTDGRVNGFPIRSTRHADYFIEGWNGVDAATLDLNKLPFRLLAIVNRLDLAKIGYSGAGGGEIRFVFGLVNYHECRSFMDRMTVIFEYRAPASTCLGLKHQAQRWLELDELTPGTSAYATALQAITDQVTRRGVAATALNQLRTNDFALSQILPDAPDLEGAWSFLEFKLDGASGLLEPVPTKLTPDVRFRSWSFGEPVIDETTELVNLYLEQNSQAILCESHSVPSLFDGVAFLAGNPVYDFGDFWRQTRPLVNPPSNFPTCHNNGISVATGSPSLADRIASEIGHKFSLNTCSGCHAGETDTGFTHISPLNRSLSGFMTGTDVPDPIDARFTRRFDEFERRGQILTEIAGKMCFSGTILDSSFARNAMSSVAVH